MAVVVGVGYWLHLNRVREPLKGFSERALAAIDRKDGAALAGMLYPEEQRVTGLNGERIDKLLTWFHDSMKGFSVEAQSFRGDKERDGVGSLERYYRASDGTEATLSLYVVRDEGGPRLFLSHPVVMCALLAKYKPKFRQEPDRVAHWEAIRAGIEAERSAFAAIPLSGVADTTGRQFLSWATLSKFAADTVARHRRTYDSRTQSGQG